MKGTPFSRCVTALAKLGAERTDSPRVACNGLSKKHVSNGAVTGQTTHSSNLQ